MRIHDRARFWGATEAERGERHQAASALGLPSELLVRGIDIEAASALAFRWVCQLTVAPYSYDLIDNLGRRSPTTLTRGADQLRVGQRMLNGRIIAFESGRSVTLMSSAWSDRLFGGPILITYSVRELAPHRSRLVVQMSVAAAGWFDQFRMVALAWGDLVMMRKQLRTLKLHAEEDAKRPSTSAGTAP